jgi:hypothetical protein
MRIEGSSRPVTKDDEKKQDFAIEILRQSNAPIVDFAKMMVPTSLTAVGAILALFQNWRPHPTSATRTWMICSCILALAAAPLFASAAYARRVRISPVDYEDVFTEVLRAAASRQRMISVGMALLGAAILIAAGVLTL